MFLFIRLYLAHLIADYPLQTDKIYQLKVRSNFGLLIHAGIAALMTLVFMWPFLNHYETWLFAIMIWISHAIQDKIKLLHSAKHQRSNNVYGYCLDQIFHLLFVAIVFLTPLKNWISPKSPSLWLSWYYSDALIYFLIGFLLSTWSATYFIGSFKETFLKKELQTPYFTKIDKYYGIVERSLFFTLSYVCTIWAVILIPLLFFIRILYSNWQIKKSNQYCMRGFIIDGAMGLIVSFILGKLVFHFIGYCIFS